MATSDLEVRIRDQYQGAGVGKLGDELERVNRNAGTAQRGMLPLVATIGDVMNIAGQAGRVFETAFDLAKEGAGIQRANERLERMAATINSTADSITTRLQAATGGIVSNAELTASALQIISLGLAQNEDDVIRLGTVVAGLGLDMQQVILTFANNSIMRLDALGLSVDDVRARAAAFEAQGFDANKAFDAAVLAALEGRLQTLSGGIEDNAAIFQRFEAQVDNLKDSFKVFMAEGLTPVLAALTGTNARVFEGIIEGQRDAAESLDDYIAMGQRLSEIGGIWLGLGVVASGNADVHHTALVRVAQDMATTTDSFWSFKQAFDQAFDWNAQYNIFGGLSNEADLRIFYEAALVMERMGDALDNAWQPAKSLATATSQLAATAKDASVAIRDGTGAIEGWVGWTSLLGTGTHTAALSNRELAGTTYEIRDAAEPLPAIIRDVAAAMVEQREANIQMQAEFNAGITSYLQGADAADFYTTAFDELGRTTYTYTTIAGGNREELERLQRVYDQTLQDIRDYDAGIKGVTLSEDARARKLDELREKANNTQAAMAGLGTVTAVTGSTFNAAEFDTQKLRSALLEQSLAAGAGTFQIQQLMEATGQYSDEQIRAALNAAAMQEKIEVLAGMIAEGTITVEDAIERLDDFAEALAQPFGIYIETGPLKGAISDLEKLIALYGTAAGLAGAIDAGELGGGGSGSGGSGGTDGTTGGGDTFTQGDNTGMAAGGYVAAAQPYLVGERGPELFVPAQGGYVVNNSDLRGGQDINIYIQDAGSLHLRGQIVDATGLLADQLGVRG